MTIPTIIDFYNKLDISPIIGLLIVIVFIILLGIFILFNLLDNEPLDVNSVLDE